MAQLRIAVTARRVKALEWVIDQYQVSSDKRSGITHSPNRPDAVEYIVRLLGQVITVSLETVQVVKGLPVLATRGTENWIEHMEFAPTDIQCRFRLMKHVRLILPEPVS